MGRLAGVLAGRCKGSERFSRGQNPPPPPFALKLPHDLVSINTWKGRRGQRQDSLAGDRQERLGD